MHKINDTKTASAARRLAAYRQRLKEEKLARVEIVLPATVCDTAQNIARKEGANYSQTVGALVQLGLEAYSNSQAAYGVSGNKEFAQPNISPSSLTACVNNGQPPAVHKEAIACIASQGTVMPDDNVVSPLAKFFKARKEGHHE